MPVHTASTFSTSLLPLTLPQSPYVSQYARHQQYHVFRLVFLLYLLLPTAFLIFRVRFVFIGFASVVVAVCCVDMFGNVSYAIYGVY